MLIPLTINAAYLPSWGVKEGLRELVQNWLDAGPSCDPLYEEGRVTLVNEGTIDRSALLIGTTSKAGAKDQRGQFGEGLKLGALALVRSNKSVTVYTGTERWSASLRKSPALGVKVLTWSIHPDATRGIAVDIGNVTEAEWRETCGTFRHFDADKPSLANYHGALLLDRPGKLYVKGILVEENSGYRFGYDFADATVDRDRRMVSSFDASYHAACLLDGAREAGIVDARTLLRLAVDGAKDTAALTWACNNSREAMARAFRDEHGEMAVICRNPGDAQTCTNLNAKGITLPSSAADMIGKWCRSVDDIKAAARDAVEAEHDDLTDTEQRIFAWSCMMAAKALGIPELPDVKVVTFRDPKLAGMFRRGTITVARNGLSDPHDLLATLIHEVAHFVAMDGTREHEAVVEAAWTNLARAFLAAPAATMVL